MDFRELFMFESHFGFQHPPFAATPDPRSWFATPRLRELVDELVIRLETGQGICLLTGAAGLGKSLLCRVIAQELAAPCHVLYLAAPAVLAPRSLFQTLLSDLDHSLPRLDLHELRLALLQTLREQVRADRPCVLLVDEAHLLPRRLFEELRALTVLDEQAQPLLRLMLCGQPRLEELLTGPEFDALNQQVASHQLLEPLSLTESVEYILHRIYWAGGDTAGLFSIPALDFIVQACAGIPRLLNRLCDQSLLVAQAAQRVQVDLPEVESALESLRHLPLAWNEEFLRRRGLSDASQASFGQFSKAPDSPLDPESAVANSVETSGPDRWIAQTRGAETLDESHPMDDDHERAVMDEVDDEVVDDVVDPDVWPTTAEHAAVGHPAIAAPASHAPDPEWSLPLEDDPSADFAEEPVAPIALPWRDTGKTPAGITPATGDFEPIEESYELDGPRDSLPSGVTFDERALAEEWSRRLRQELPPVPLALPPEPPLDISREGRVPPAWSGPVESRPAASSPTNPITQKLPWDLTPESDSRQVRLPPGMLTPRLAIGSLTERSFNSEDLVYDVIEPEAPSLDTPRTRRPRLVNGIQVVSDGLPGGSAPAACADSSAVDRATVEPRSTETATANSVAVEPEKPAFAAVAVAHPPHELPAPRGSTGPGLGRLFTLLRRKSDAQRSGGER